MSATDKSTKFRLQSSSVTTIISLSLVLFMLGLLGLLILNTKQLADHFKENIGFQIILKDEAKQADIEKLNDMLKSTTYVKSTQFITKDEAAKTLQQDLGEDFVTFIGYNPLKASIDVRFKAEYTNQDSIGWIEQQILENKNVKELVYPKSLISNMNSNMKKVGIVLLSFSAVLMLIAIALINNTIRLSIYSKRFIIKTMQLVGATQAFIRLPFVLKGMQQGIYSAIIAILLLMGVLFFSRKQLPDIVVVDAPSMLALLFGLVIMLGIAIGTISTALAVRKYLRLRSDELYY